LITCGVHSTEVGSYLSSMLIAEKLANAADAETRKILDDTIILLVPSLNPDGVDIVKNWYDKTLGTPFEGTEPPELYHKYVGHDDNHDRFDLRRLDARARLFALSRRRPDFIGNRFREISDADHGQVRRFATRFRLRPEKRNAELRARLERRRMAHRRHH